ncbi:hypothetical protein BGZ96_006526 [Linnemannia gamsii]|uniref:Uncharacterized protein n=1 Tax=Linnemannia gamsii TaxID=64522 RepID=A0ABQ7K4Q1_9FUNG|nr:hypothetical protein BGZ96_006526 [Linnemannia gamsii]
MAGRVKFPCRSVSPIGYEYDGRGGELEILNGDEGEDGEGGEGVESEEALVLKSTPPSKAFIAIITIDDDDDDDDDGEEGEPPPPGKECRL